MSLLRYRAARNGFTFVEMMTVMLIIGILAAILVPNYYRAYESSQYASCEANLKNIATSLTAYSNDNANAFPTQLDGLTPTYIKVMPTCPSAGTDTYSAGYTHQDDISAFTVACDGNNHYRWGLNAPYYNTTTGLGP